VSLKNVLIEFLKTTTLPLLSSSLYVFGGLATTDLELFFMSKAFYFASLL